MLNESVSYTPKASLLFKTVSPTNLLIDEVKAVDILGNIVYETTLMPQTSTLHIDFVGFSKGIYFVEIKNAQQIQVRYKLVKL